MPSIILKEVISYSSEDGNHPAKNLLKPESFLKWKCSPECKDRQSYVILKLEKLSTIHSINIGNENSGMVEILAGREGTDFQVLLVSSSFMTPLESRNTTNINRVRMFGPDKLNTNIATQEWDKIKIVCTQLYNKNVQYGLSFIHLQSNKREKSNILDDFGSSLLPNEIKLGRFTLKESILDNASIPVGSLFAQIKETESATSASIRAASKAAVLPKLPISQDSEQNVIKRKLSNTDEIDSDIGFYQLKKNIKATSSPMPLKKGTLSPIPQNKSNLSPVPNKKVKSSPVLSKKEFLTVPQKIIGSKTTEFGSSVTKVKKINLLTGDASNNKHKSQQYKPFKKLMDNVIFVMSGYQNPKRSQLRDKLFEMGAKYKIDWDKTCTHLICAYANTPKCQAVKGKGKIVSGKWVDDCYHKKMRLPWRRYNLEKDRADESEEEILASELLSKQDQSDLNTKNYEVKVGSPMEEDSEDTDDEIGKVISFKKVEGVKKAAGIINMSNIHNSDDDYDADTDLDEDIMAHKAEASNLPLPVLLDLFQGKTFHLYGFISKTKEKSIIRYIVAYGGILSSYMNSTVNYVITESNWDDNFDDALAENPSLHFVNPQWIWKCCNRQIFVPPQPFLISCIET